MAEKTYVFPFGTGLSGGEDGPPSRARLGWTGATLADLAAAGFPVPPGFTVSTEACAYISKTGGTPPSGLFEEIRQRLRDLETRAGRRYGDPRRPLLVAVRTSAAVDLPGLQPAVLHLGLTEKTVAGLAAETGSPRAAWDAYRRLLAGFGAQVLGAPAHLLPADFERETARALRTCGARRIADLDADRLAGLCGAYQRIYQDRTGRPFPQDPLEQLRLAIQAALLSWHSEAARAARRGSAAPGLLGVAVHVQAMALGVLDAVSGAGTAGSRDPRTGAAEPGGEFLARATGADLAPGAAAPRPLAELAAEGRTPAERAAWAALHAQALDLARRVERHYRQPQEIQFTAENGRLSLLGARPLRGAGGAALRWAVDMTAGRDAVTGKSQPKLLTPPQAVQAMAPSDLDHLLAPRFAPEAEAQAVKLGIGRGSRPGVASGRLVFSAAEALARFRYSPQTAIILARPETGPADEPALKVCRGLLTTGSGRQIHARLAARDGGRCAITAVAGLTLDPQARALTAGPRRLKEGDWVSLDGATGIVYAGALPEIPSPVSAALVGPRPRGRRHPEVRLYRQISAWADQFRALGVRALADTAAEAARARAFGAEGLCGCRAEAWFPAAERRATAAGLPELRAAAEALFAGLGGGAAAVRLCDVSAARPGGGRFAADTRAAFARQAQAALEAVSNLARRGIRIGLEFLVPGVIARGEFEDLQRDLRAAAAAALKSRRLPLSVRFGAVVETPRAALLADELAETADLLVFDVPALTAAVFGHPPRLSEAAALADYLDEGHLAADPYGALDTAGVGRLLETAIRQARATRPAIVCGVCGDAAADPAGLRFCARLGVNFVGCTPDRVASTRLAAAQAALRSRGEPRGAAPTG